MKMGSNESQFHVLLIVRVRVTNTVRGTHILTRMEIGRWIYTSL